MITFREYLIEKEGYVTQEQLNVLEKMLDKLFASLDIDVEFTRHFLDRVNDERNQKQITIFELTDLFGKVYNKYGKQIKELNPDAEAVLKDISTSINVPFVIEYDRRKGMLELISKTVMRKKDFKTRNKVYKV